MIRFIIVDDEPLALDSFVNLLVWERYGFHCEGAASNGKEALDLLSKHKADIVFTDIRMPVMDGLELCRNIQQQYPHVAMVILTAYRDFDYARMAVTCGVHEYLLKNQLEPEKVLDLLSRLRDRIEEERDRRQAEKRHYYQNIMLNMTTEKEIAFDKEGAGYCILIQRRVPFIEDMLGEYREESLRISYEGIKELLSFQTGLELMQVVWVDGRSWGLLFSLSESAIKKDMDISSCMREVCRKLEAYFLNQYNEEIFALFGQCGEEPHRVKYILEEMRDCADYSIFMRRIPYCDYHLIRNMFRNSHSGHGTLDELIGEAEELLKKSQTERLDEVFDKLYKVFTIPTYDLGKFRYIFCKLTEQLMSIRQKYQMDVTWKVNQGKPLYYAEELWKWIKKSYEDIANFNVFPQKTSSNGKIQQALKYIHANYSKKITVGEVGEHIGLSEVYFSNLFKREAGATFGEYLTSYRMGLAKHMISHGDYRVYEIAEKVGYSSAQYFSQIFQKETGLTPLEYKKTVNNYDG